MDGPGTENRCIGDEQDRCATECAFPGQDQCQMDCQPNREKNRHCTSQGRQCEQSPGCRELTAITDFSTDIDRQCPGQQKYEQRFGDDAIAVNNEDRIDRNTESSYCSNANIVR